MLRVLKSSANPPLTNFDFGVKFFVPENEQLMQDFFVLCSPFIQTLKVQVNRSIFSFPFSPKFLKSVTLCQLKVLTYEDMTPNMESYDPGIEHCCESLFASIVSASPNLETLDISFPQKMMEANEEHVISQIPVIPSSYTSTKYPKQLKHLEISGRMTDSHIKSLSADPGCCFLKSLHLRLMNSTLSRVALKNALESHKCTLEHFQITEERIGSDVVIEFPMAMSKLKKITMLSICEFEMKSVSLANFGYQEHLPCLESLILWNSFGRSGRWEQFFLASSPSQTLSVLELPNHFRNPSLAKNICIVMPFLKRLKVGFSLRPENEEVMRVIFSTLQCLEELEIFTDMDNQNERIDHVLSGIPIQECISLNTSEMYLQPEYIGSVKRMPSLLNLTSE